MAFSSGTFSLDAANPTTGTTISSTWAASVLNGIATGLTTCLLKDGTQTATALVPFAAGLSSATGTLQYPASTVVGRWTTPTFAAGDYTANGSMTWTVASGDVTTMAYTITDKVMTMSFKITTTTVGGTPNISLRIAVPASKTITKNMVALCMILDNDIITTGYIEANAGLTYISITRTDRANFSASTNLTEVQGQITFEIN